MTWSYDERNPGSSQMSLVRLLIGDTSSGSQLLQDEEINALLGLEGNTFNAAALACESVASRFAQRADQKVGQLQIKLSQIADRFEARAQYLRKRGRTYGASIYAGGISHSDMESVIDNTDEVRGRFTVGMHDLPGADLYDNAGDSTSD